MPLRGETLRCTGGELYAHVTENPDRARSIQLAWALYLDGAPVLWDDGEWNTSFQFDGLTWPIRRWPAFIDAADFEAPTFDEERRRFVFEPRDLAG